MNTCRFALVWSLLLLAICGSDAAYGVEASPHPFEVKQPDGSTVTLHIRGDEYFHWLEDVAGYTVLQSGDAYVYATATKSGLLMPTNELVGSADPKALGLEKRLLPAPDVMDKKRAEWARVANEAQKGADRPSRVSPLGTVQNLVVPIRFTNHTTRTLPTKPELRALFNDDHPAVAPSGSVRDIYYENSYGQLSLDSKISDWIDVPKSEQYYANGNSGDETLWQALRAALNTLDDTVDFRDFDKDGDQWVDVMTFLHSGYAAEAGSTDADGVASRDRIWSHRWTMSMWTSDEGVRVADYHISPALWGTSGTAIGRVGVICHETGHFFGLPDLYDTSKPGEGIGSWGMMANSWGFDGTQYHPPHFSAWSKVRLGWTTPTEITVPGIYSINEWALNNEVYRINLNYPSGEYLLIENRQPAGVESTIPQGGLTVFHIDDFSVHGAEGYPGQAGWPANGKHYRVAVLQADGAYDLEQGYGRGDTGDVYHAGGVSRLGPDTLPSTNAYQFGNIVDTKVEISEISASGPTMTFRFDDGDALSVTPPAVLSSVGARGGPFAPASKTYTLTNTDGGSAQVWTATVLGGAPWVRVGSGGGTLPPLGTTSLNVTIDSAAAAALPSGHYADTVRVTNTTSGWHKNLEVTLTVAAYWFPLDASPGWTTTGQWQFGPPLGLGGTFGNPDPAAAATGANVYGYNLSGDYADDLFEPEFLTTAPLDFTNYENVHFGFKRWLGVEDFAFDLAFIQIQVGESAWQPLWYNGEYQDDGAWVSQDYDIGAFADGHDDVRLRWGMGPTDGSVTFCGWNIDDVIFYGDAVDVGNCDDPPTLALNGPAVLNVECGATYSEQGATAQDECDGDLSIAVVVTSPVNTSLPGFYTVTYNVSDLDGNAAAPVTRNVWVEDTAPPAITVNGATFLSVDCGSVYVDQGATALDVCGGNRTSAIKIENPVDTATPGTYAVTYDVSDGVGNHASPAYRLVVVSDNCAEEGEYEGDGVGPVPHHTADQDGDRHLTLGELLRIVQFFNARGLHCAYVPESTEDGYEIGERTSRTRCWPHASDFNGTDWEISLSELLRAVQLFSVGSYHVDCGTEDGFTPGDGLDIPCG